MFVGFSLVSLSWIYGNLLFITIELYLWAGFSLVIPPWIYTYRAFSFFFTNMVLYLWVFFSRFYPPWCSSLVLHHYRFFVHRLLWSIPVGILISFPPSYISHKLVFPNLYLTLCMDWAYVFGHEPCHQLDSLRSWTILVSALRHNFLFNLSHIFFFDSKSYFPF